MRRPCRQRGGRARGQTSKPRGRRGGCRLRMPRRRLCGFALRMPNPWFERMLEWLQQRLSGRFRQCRDAGLAGRTRQPVLSSTQGSRPARPSSGEHSGRRLAGRPRANREAGAEEAPALLPREIEMRSVGVHCWRFGVRCYRSWVLPSLAVLALVSIRPAVPVSGWNRYVSGRETRSLTNAVEYGPCFHVCGRVQ